MEVYVLAIEDEEVYTNVFLNKENAINCIIDDLKDRNHFDTDEPYCSQEELLEKISCMREEISNYGYWEDDEVKYYVNKNTIYEKR